VPGGAHGFGNGLGVRSLLVSLCFLVQQVQLRRACGGKRSA